MICIMNQLNQEAIAVVVRYVLRKITGLRMDTGLAAA